MIRNFQQLTLIIIMLYSEWHKLKLNGKLIKNVLIQWVVLLTRSQLSLCCIVSCVSRIRVCFCINHSLSQFTQPQLTLHPIQILNIQYISYSPSYRLIELFFPVEDLFCIVSIKPICIKLITNFFCLKSLKVVECIENEIKLKS